MSVWAIGFFIYILFIIYMFYLVKNNYVLDVRDEFMYDDKLYPQRYRALPAYRTMLFHPAHLFRFTKKQWVEWVNRKLGQS